MGYISDYLEPTNNSTTNKNTVNSLRDSIALDCINLILIGYEEYINDSDKVLLADEPTISAGLYGKIDDILCTSTKYPYIISPEYPDYTKDFIKGKVRAKKAKRYDFLFMNFEVRPKAKFGVEAKLLLSKNKGNKKSSKLISEYISNKGMGKYINGIYSKNGLMLGYVLDGNSCEVVDKINVKILKEYSSQDVLSKLSEKDFPYNSVICTSEHSLMSTSLFHVLLNFDNIQ